MKNLTGPFSRLKRCKVLVAGDLILDAYTIGKASRISPEAPVAVVNVQQESNLPGGAGNAMLNLAALGADVVALGRVGCDAWGNKLIAILQAEGVDTVSIVQQMNFPTPVKNRIIASGQQIVRIDHECDRPLPVELEESLIANLDAIFDHIDILAISDYNKGFLTQRLLRALIEQAQKRNISVVVDPKGIDFSKYAGATIIKPNLTEAYAAANLTHDYLLEVAAQKILQQTNAESLMVTRSEAGISLYHKNGAHEHFPVVVREVKDVTGAGDTVLAMLTYALGSGLAFSEAAQLCNVAAGLAIEHFGCARISLNELAARLLDHDKGNKVFDRQHLHTLKYALKGKDYVLIILPAQEELNKEMFAYVNAVKERNTANVVVTIDKCECFPLFIKMIASLHDVDYVLLGVDAANELTDYHPPLYCCDYEEQESMLLLAT